MCQKLILIRGLPGSGKSTIAQELSYVGFKWFEADQYFTDDDGDYHYDASKIRQAHEWCQKLTSDALSSGYDVVVSNTFTRRFEMQPYFDMCKMHGIKPNIIEMVGSFGNVHGVPDDVIEKMRNRWERIEGEEL